MGAGPTGFLFESVEGRRDAGRPLFFMRPINPDMIFSGDASADSPPRNQNRGGGGGWGGGPGPHRSRLFRFAHKGARRARSNHCGAGFSSHECRVHTPDPLPADWRAGPCSGYLVMATAGSGGCLMESARQGQQKPGHPLRHPGRALRPARRIILRSSQTSAGPGVTAITPVFIWPISGHSAPRAAYEARAPAERLAEKHCSQSSSANLPLSPARPAEDGPPKRGRRPTPSIRRAGLHGAIGRTRQRSNIRAGSRSSRSLCPRR